jgi:hypothetical protein
MADWTLDIFFKRDVTMLKIFVEEREEQEQKEQKNNYPYANKSHKKKIDKTKNIIQTNSMRCYHQTVFCASFCC